MFRKFLVASLSVNALLSAACCDPITTEHLPGRYENNFYVQGDFLYWYAKQQGTEYAATGSALTVPGTLDPTTGLIPSAITSSGFVYEPKPGMEPGFRAGAGLNLEQGKWDLFLEYTYLSSHAKGSIASFELNTGIIPVLGVAPTNSSLSLTTVAGGTDGFVSLARSNWGLHFNNLTFELGRSLEFCPLFGLRPHFGLQGSWINQHLHAHYDVNSLADFTTLLGHTRARFQQSYWGVGLRAGLDSYWSCFRYLGLFANSALSALWGQFNTHTRFYDTVIGGHNHVLIGDQRFRPHTLSPVVQLEIGAQFDWVFRNCRSMMFQLGWEGQVWFFQNQFVARTSDTSLVMQGLTFKAKFGY
jgi:hypothetical protein